MGDPTRGRLKMSIRAMLIEPDMIQAREKVNKARLRNNTRVLELLHMSEKEKTAAGIRRPLFDISKQLN